MHEVNHGRVGRSLPWLACFALIFIAQRALAQDAAACLDCHEDKKIYQQSVHKDMQCADCHQGFKEFPDQTIYPLKSRKHVRSLNP